MSSFVLRNGLVVGVGSSEVTDLLIEDGRITEVGERLVAPSSAKEIDAEGCWVGPGFVDLHTHLR
jgi:dihydropyrimidinase